MGKNLDIELVSKTEQHTLHEIKDSNDVVTSVEQRQHGLKGSLFDGERKSEGNEKKGQDEVEEKAPRTFL